MKFLYTDDQNTVNDLKKAGYPLIKQTSSGMYVFLNIDEKKHNFDKNSKIVQMDEITF